MSTTDDRRTTSPPTETPAEPRSTVNLPVFIGAAVGVIAITAWAALSPSTADAVLGSTVEWVGINLGWWYVLVVAAVLVFVVVVAASRAGRTRLGPDHSRPQFSLFTWTAMLFAAGIGIDLMFFSVSEPVSQYLDPPQGSGESTEAARQAVVWTLFHYGLAGWGLYALMGLAFAYFAYRHDQPLSFRSALRPVLGSRVDGWTGHAVDIAALLGAIFGIATSLGIGVVQLNYGLAYLGGLPENVWMQAALVGLAVAMATISVVTGVEKGIRRLSELNIVLAIALMVFVLIAGSTSFLLDGIVTNVGDSVSRFPSMILDTMAYDRPDTWLSSWTLFFWAWWIAWAPFVGLFLARISRGRTIRQYVTGVLVVPFAFILLWISIFGNSALVIVRGGADGFAETAANVPERAFYTLLDQYPAALLLAAVATFTGLLFYVTSADSGALVMSNFSSRLPSSDADGPSWLRIFWAVATGLLTLATLTVGGVQTLQNATIVVGLPFSVVTVLVMVGLWRALRVETSRDASVGASLPAALSGRLSRTEPGGWRHRLRRATSYPDAAGADRFVRGEAIPALTEVAEELQAQDVPARVTVEADGPLGVTQAELRVAMGRERDFRYQVYPLRGEVPSFARMPSRASTYVRVEAFSENGSYGYDLTGYTREQLIGDVLDHYEAHLEFLRSHDGAPGSTAVQAAHDGMLRWDGDFAADPAAEHDRANGDAPGGDGAAADRHDDADVRAGARQDEEVR